MLNVNRSPISVLLADDDNDDRFFFNRAISSFPNAHLITVEDGAELLSYLETATAFPDVIFLDLNMPKTNGYECLIAIQLNERLRKIPVIIYSTHVDEHGADELCRNGAYYYVKKGGMEELRQILTFLFSRLTENNLTRPNRDAFVLALK
jgi:CheY-like chemotaxis protein